MPRLSPFALKARVIVWRENLRNRRARNEGNEGIGNGVGDDDGSANTIEGPDKINTVLLQRLYDAHNAVVPPMLLFVDALYESADACPPLKSAVGGIRAIVKLYSVCYHVPSFGLLSLQESRRSREIGEIPKNSWIDLWQYCRSSPILWKMRRACRLNCNLTYKRSPSKRNTLYLTPRLYSTSRSTIDSIQRNLQAYFNKGWLSRISYSKEYRSQIEGMKVQLSNAIEDYKVSLIEIVASIFSLRVRVDKELI